MTEYKVTAHSTLRDTFYVRPGDIDQQEQIRLQGLFQNALKKQPILLITWVKSFEVGMESEMVGLATNLDDVTHIVLGWWAHKQIQAGEEPIVIDGYFILVPWKVNQFQTPPEKVRDVAWIMDGHATILVAPQGE
jgi:hypothetical protein